MIQKMLMTRIAEDSTVNRLGQAACFLGASLILILAFNKLAAIDLTEGQLVIGLLASLSAALFFTLLGVLLHLLDRRPKA